MCEVLVPINKVCLAFLSDSVYGLLISWPSQQARNKLAVGFQRKKKKNLHPDNASYVTFKTGDFH